MSTTYQATAVKDSGRWWLVEVPEVGAYGQAASLADAEAVAREVTALALDVDPSEVTITLTAKPDEQTAAALARAEEMAAEGAALTKKAAQVRAEAVRRYIAEQKVTRREAARALGMTAGRVQQIISA